MGVHNDLARNPSYLEVVPAKSERLAKLKTVVCTFIVVLILS